MMDPLCDWCGHRHDMTALCAKRPTWGRRGFLALFGTGLAGLAIGGLPSCQGLAFHKNAFVLTWPDRHLAAASAGRFLVNDGWGTLSWRTSDEFSVSEKVISKIAQDLADRIDQKAVELFYRGSQWPRS